MDVSLKRSINLNPFDIGKQAFSWKKNNQALDKPTSI